MLPHCAPRELCDLQTLVHSIDNSEARRDARTGREIIGSLPNELSAEELARIVRQFVAQNITCYGLCAIAAIHKGKSDLTPAKNNPHVHMIASTRPVDSKGFLEHKDRDHDGKDYLIRCREQWAQLISRAYERNGLDSRVDHRSFRAQGIDREPLRHLSRMDMEREKRGERTFAGDQNRAILSRNAAKERSVELDISR